MTALAFRTTTVLAVISANLILISCSGETGPQPGTTAFFWGAARETFASGDYVKTLDNLDKVEATDNEFTAKARPWLMVLSAGEASGYMEIADRYEAGSKASKTESAMFRRNMNNNRVQARTMALHFAEVFGKFQQSKDENVPLAFPYPTGSPSPPIALTKAASGILSPAADLENAQQQNIQRAVLLMACNAVGAPDDPAKAQEAFKGANPQVPRAVFILAMASALYDQSQLFSRTKLDDPDKMKGFCTLAQNALKTIPETKATKDLNAKISKALKAKG